MPVFALAYGSVGDIIATVQLVTKLVTLLHRDSSQSSECAEKELKSLSSDVYLAFLTRVQTSESLIAKRIQDEVALCHQVMYRFFAMITAPKTFLQKLQWAVCQGKELAAFRTQVHERRMALNLVVNLINSRTLLAVQDRIDQVGGHVSDAHNMLRDVQDYVNGLTQQIAVYHEQVVADHVPHGVAEATFVVISPTGIPIPISVIFCSSYQDLDRIVKAYLHGRKEAGCCYVERGDYSIVSPKGDILRPPEFLTTLRDGIRLEMCIIKRDTARGWQKCPQCGHRSTGASSNVGWITCQNPSCGSRYRLNVDRSLPEQQARKTSSPPHQTAPRPPDEDTTFFRLVQVMMKHTGERPFACYCTKQFSSLDNLRQHAQTVHSAPEDKSLNERMMRALAGVNAIMMAGVRGQRPSSK